MKGNVIVKCTTGDLRYGDVFIDKWDRCWVVVLTNGRDVGIQPYSLDQHRTVGHIEWVGPRRPVRHCKSESFGRGM